jgi:transposase-like protein
MYYKTVWHMLQKLRHAMGRRDANISLSGTLELDEAILGPQARKTGRVKKDKRTELQRKPRPKRLGRPSQSGGTRKTQTEVVVMIEQEPHGAGFVAMQVVDRATRETIAEVVDQRVLPNQFFKTDAIQYHYVLKTMGHYLDARVSSGPIACKFLPLVHRAISLLKRFLIGTYHGVSSRYLQRYLQEFCFRFNRKHKESTIYESLLRASLLCVPMTYAELKL